MSADENRREIFYTRICARVFVSVNRTTINEAEVVVVFGDRPRRYIAVTVVVVVKRDARF